MKVLLSTSHGDIELTLDAERAPETTSNFVEYVRDGHYDGTVFHRVIPGFMIQGGGFEPGMSQRATRAAIRNEADNGLRNAIGAVAMARTSEPHSASAQFFINTAENGFLDHSAPTPEGWGYCVFGAVSAGMEVVQSIEQASTGSRGGHQDVPLEDVVIAQARELDA
jgi:peptidyl-prolyl cis-trans isomerase B (cyclophilin B)